MSGDEGVNKLATVIYRDRTDNISWGWFTGSGRPMHLQRFDSDKEVARVILLERDGRRVFEPEVGHRRVVLDRLEEHVERHRLQIERLWLTSLAREGRLVINAQPGSVLVTVYPREAIERGRSIVIPGGTMAVVHIEGAVLVVEHEPEERPIRIDLADVLYGERERRRAWLAPSARSSI